MGMNKYQLAHKDDPEYRARNRKRANLWYKANKARRQAYLKQKHLANPGAEVQRVREYYLKHREERNEFSRQHYQRNRDKHLALCKKYVLENYEKTQAYKSCWAKEHPIEMRLAKAKRRAKTYGAKIAKEDIHNWESRICGICVDFIEDKFEIDHIIPLSRGGEHTLGNLQLAHPHCNRVKHNKLPSELVMV